MCKPDGLLQVLDSADGVERTGHDLGRARSLRIVGQLAFEELGVGQDHPQLVVQPMKQADDLRVEPGIRRGAGDVVRRHG